MVLLLLLLLLVFCWFQDITARVMWL